MSAATPSAPRPPPAPSASTGSGGNAYSHYAYPAVPYGNDDFHHCGRNGNDDIVDYGDKWEVQNCELVDLSDLRTESSYVRGKLTAYLGGAGEPGPEEYAGFGDVTEFRYGDVVGGAFAGGNLSGLGNLADSVRLGSGDAVAFVDNHDTQRNGRAKLTYKNGSAYALADAFMIAWPYGVPQVMSSFTFSNAEAGPPAASNGTTNQVSCGNGWECEHRWRTTANMVALRNVAAGAGVTNWWSNGSNQIAFGRGSKGFAAFNRSGSALTRTFQTSLPAGTYCDVMAGDLVNGSCTGPAYAANGSGQVTATVAADAVLALHVNARTSGSTTPAGCTTAATTFAATVSTAFGQDVFVTGNTAALGNWNSANAVALSSAAYPVWRATVSLPGNTSVQYKYIKKQGSTVIRESDPDRTRTTAAASPCTATWNDTWR